MIRYIARYKYPEIDKIEIFEESKNSVYINGGFEIKKKSKDFSLHNSFEEAKQALTDEFISKINDYKALLGRYESFLVATDFLSYNDVQEIKNWGVIVIKYIARYEDQEIRKTEIFEESKHSVWLKNGIEIPKISNGFSLYNSFEEAKRALLNNLVAKIHKHESKVDSYQDLLVKVNDITEEDVK